MLTERNYPQQELGERLKVEVKQPRVVDLAREDPARGDDAIEQAQRVQIDDHAKEVALFLVFHHSFDHSEVISNMELTGRLDSRQDPFFHSICIYSIAVTGWATE